MRELSVVRVKVVRCHLCLVHFSIMMMICNIFFLGEIKYDDKLTEEDGVYIQAAILFTSCSGQRRLRVINLALNTGSSMAEMYRNCK